MDNFKINPFVAWFFLMAVAGIVAGMTGNIDVMFFCGAGVVAGGFGWAIKHDSM